MQNNNLITVPELCSLIHELIEKRPDIGIRFRMLGEMWSNHFMHAAFLARKSGIFKHEQNGNLIAIQDLSNVMQFELDHSFYNFQAYFHYEVKPVSEYRQFAIADSQL
jgi:hypothetical protein